MSQTLTVPTLTLENGTTLRDVPVAYRTWGTLNATGTNAVLVCHALTGDTNVADWWGGLLGPGRALDPTEDFVVCLNVPGSPYGSVAPVTVNPDTGERYGAGFPPFTTRDTVRLHRRALETLGVRRVACAVGGSMGGMHVLEWAFEATDGGAPFVRSLVPIAVGGAPYGLADRMEGGAAAGHLRRSDVARRNIPAGRPPDKRPRDGPHDGDGVVPVPAVPRRPVRAGRNAGTGRHALRRGELPAPSRQ